MSREEQIDLLRGLSSEDVAEILYSVNDLGRIGRAGLLDFVDKALCDKETIRFEYDSRYVGGVVRISIGDNLYPQATGVLCRFEDIMPYVLRYRRNKSISELL